MMGVTETISENLDDYVAAAVRLARDPQWYQAVKDRMAASKQRVYRDRACIAALEDFLDRVGRESVPTM
jgi:predicted O-linked N-acetylglucosamine transferase (SPINDLY family)